MSNYSVSLVTFFRGPEPRVHRPTYTRKSLSSTDAGYCTYTLLYVLLTHRLFATLPSSLRLTSRRLYTTQPNLSTHSSSMSDEVSYFHCVLLNTKKVMYRVGGCRERVVEKLDSIATLSYRPTHLSNKLSYFSTSAIFVTEGINATDDNSLKRNCNEHAQLTRQDSLASGH